MYSSASLTWSISKHFPLWRPWETQPQLSLLTNPFNFSKFLPVKYEILIRELFFCLSFHLNWVSSRPLLLNNCQVPSKKWLNFISEWSDCCLQYIEPNPDTFPLPSLLWHNFAEINESFCLCYWRIGPTVHSFLWNPLIWKVLHKYILILLSFYKGQNIIGHWKFMETKQWWLALTFSPT